MPESAKPWSLKTRVALISTVALCTGLLLGSVGMFIADLVEDDNIVDEQVELIAKNILRSGEDGRAQRVAVGLSPYLPSADDPPETGLHRYQVWLNDGSRLLKSHSASQIQPMLPLNVSGLSHIKIEGMDFCVYAVTSQDQALVVQVAIISPHRMLQIAFLLGLYIACVLLPFALILGVNRWLLKRSFDPLDVMADNLLHRGPYDVTPMAIDNPPKEMLPIVNALDSHFRRVGRAMSAEHRFTSVAAHEIRTPLAGIRAQAQVASAATDPLEIKESLKSVMQGVDRAARVIEQLIDLNRVESTGEDIEWRNLKVNLPGVYDEVMYELGPKATARKISLNVNFEENQIQGLDFAIYMLMRNLIANAILYCPEGGRIEIKTQRQGANVILTVDDSGSGIPAQKRESAFEKFNRLGKGGSDGVGLGLSIVAQVVELHRAKIDLLTSPLGGLRAQVVFRPLV
jgi:two-component system OmpR family sensor kinase/two-component system sensor histidine kinase QseC